MTAYLLKLRQSVFQVSLLTAVLLGISLAYFSSKAIDYSFSQLPSVSKALHSNPARHSLNTSSPDRSEIENLATQNLLRGTIASMETEKVEETYSNFVVEDITLIGVLAGSRRYARAVISIKNVPGVEAYAIGDEIHNGTLKAIRAKSIIITDASGQEFVFELGEDGRKEERAVSTQTPQKRQSQPAPATRVGGTERITLSRDRFKQYLQDQAELFRLKFSPDIQGKKIKGWRLIKVPKDHFLYSMGARSGDIIRRYNGQELIDQGRMINMWQSLQTANQVVIDLERGGQIVTFDINIH